MKFSSTVSFKYSELEPEPKFVLPDPNEIFLDPQHCIKDKKAKSQWK
jgi:hypothetical protein